MALLKKKTLKYDWVVCHSPKNTTENAEHHLQQIPKSSLDASWNPDHAATANQIQVFPPRFFLADKEGLEFILPSR